MTRRLAVVPDSPPRAVLYLRQSVSREDSISLELQETACRDHATRSGYTVVAVEADPGISGRTWDRPAVRRVMGMVESGDVDVVLLWKWSRLSRSRRDWAVAVDRIESLGGRLESATEPVDTATATGRFTRGMLAEMAAFESDRIGEVWREVHARRIGHGLPSRGGDRFGYVRDGDTYVPDPVTGQLLEQAYRRVADGQSLHQVTRWLRASGARTLAGGEWTRDRVTRVLDSGFGAGLLVKQGRRPGGGVDRRLEVLSWATGGHPAVVDAGTWEAYLAARRGGRRARTRDTGSYVLSGLLTCGDCGAPMHADRLGKHAGYAFACSAWKAGRPVRCVTITRHRAEAAVLAWLGTVAAELDDEAARQAAAVARQAGDEAEVASLAREAVALERRQAKLLAGWLDGLVPEQAYAAERDRIAAAQATVRAALDDLALRRRRAETGPLRPIAAGLLAEWDELPVADRRAMLGRLLARVEVHPPERRGQRATAVPVEHASV